MLGLAVGEALGARHSVPDGAAPLSGGVGTHLALFTVDGLIRASVRQRERGICHPPSIVWHALARWAYGQGIPAPHLYAEWGSGTASDWPDGWLAEVPALRERRGSAPATVAALQRGQPGTRQRPVTQSTGYHGLIRALPVGALGTPPHETFDLALDVAALTHGAPSGFITAADAALLAATLLSADDLSAGIAQAIRTIEIVDPDSHHLDRYAEAAADGDRAPADGAVLRRHGAHRTAISSLSAALYVMTSFPRPEQIFEALDFAGSTAGGGVAAVSGALLGAFHGVDALPVAAVSRLDTAWVTDMLARDLITELTQAPGGHDALEATKEGTYQTTRVNGADPDWAKRYPGW